MVTCGALRSRRPAVRAYAAGVLPKDELGNRAAFCAGCGWGRRFLGGMPVELPESCPDCGQPLIAECPSCSAGITSLMQITCAGCGEALRDAEFFGRPIRRKPERHAGIAEAIACAGEAQAAFAAEAAATDQAPACAGEAAAAFAKE
jgi:hypothetical protein